MEGGALFAVLRDFYAAASPIRVVGPWEHGKYAQSFPGKNQEGARREGRAEEARGNRGQRILSIRCPLFPMLRPL